MLEGTHTVQGIKDDAAVALTFTSSAKPNGVPQLFVAVAGGTEQREASDNGSLERVRPESDRFSPM
jgi:hypothetical protein